MIFEWISEYFLFESLIYIGLLNSIKQINLVSNSTYERDYVSHLLIIVHQV